MEADWEAEVGEGLPIIELPWSGYVDLRQDPSAIARVPEANSYPVLGESLLRLNAADSSWITAKCDAWLLIESVDAYEFDAQPNDIGYLMASYCDVLLRDAEFASFQAYETLARRLVAHLHNVPLQNGRVDCIVRRAWRNDKNNFGLTIYTSGCGADAQRAEEHWKCVLQQAVEATIVTAGNCTQAGE